jgi:hypothetical protein
MMRDNLIFMKRFSDFAMVAKFDPRRAFCHSIALRFHGVSTGLPPRSGGNAAEPSPRCRVITSAPMRKSDMLQQHHSSRFNGFKRRARRFAAQPNWQRRYPRASNYLSV